MSKEKLLVEIWKNGELDRMVMLADPREAFVREFNRTMEGTGIEAVSHTPAPLPSPVRQVAGCKSS